MKNKLTFLFLKKISPLLVFSPTSWILSCVAVLTSPFVGVFTNKPTKCFHQPIKHFGMAILLFFLLSQSSLAQELIVPRDTSYNISAAFKKVKKNYPTTDISIVSSNSSNTINVEKEIVYKTIGRRKISANIFYPKKKSSTGYPVILAIHGGGWRTGDKKMMTPMAERLAAEGYIVVVPEYRLSPEAQFPAGVEDLYSALEWIGINAKKYSIDLNLVVVLGRSAGGQLATLIGTTYHKNTFRTSDENEPVRIAAIVDMDGILAFKHPVSKEGDSAGKWLGGDYNSAKENWEKASALNHVDEKTPPTLFLASKFPRFLAGHKEYMTQLKANGIFSEKKELNDSPHGFWLFHPWYEPTIQYTLDFLDRVLK